MLVVSVRLGSGARFRVRVRFRAAIDYSKEKLT